MQELIIKIQEKLVSLLREAGDNDAPLSELSKDSCSELSRLVGFWVQQNQPYIECVILKGEEVNGGMAHDVLMVKDRQKLYLLDPSVWQFTSDHDSIFLGEFDSIENVFDKLRSMYGGSWIRSEDLTEESYNEASEWERIIRLNAKGNKN